MGKRTSFGPNPAGQDKRSIKHPSGVHRDEFQAQILPGASFGEPGWHGAPFRSG
jgi:hypothetical protein